MTDSNTERLVQPSYILDKARQSIPLTEADRDALQAHEKAVDKEAEKLDPRIVFPQNPDSPPPKVPPKVIPDADQIPPATTQRVESQENLFTIPTGVQRGTRNFTHGEAADWIAKYIPKDHQSGPLAELKKIKEEGGQYTVSIDRDWRGAYRLVKFKSREAAQSVTREIRCETGKQINRLINPDYAHNEMMREYKLVREALPEGTATHQMLEKTDKVVSAALTASGLTIEAANLLLNAIRGALLESPHLKYKVAVVIPDDLIRQSAVVAARSAGNTLRRYIHDKYHLPDRPKQTPVLVNTLDQIKPEHYRAQDAQKVGITMRDLTRENAIKFIHENVPAEKQESAIETISRLQGNQFGVSIMDSGWVRIDASAREPRKYEDRPHYDNRQKWVGSYNATDDTKMP